MCVWVQTVHPDCLGVSPGWRAFSPSGCTSPGRRRWCWPHRRLWREREGRLSFRRAPSTYEGLCWPVSYHCLPTPPPHHIHLLVTRGVLEDVSSIHRRVCTQGSPSEARPVPAQRALRWGLGGAGGGEWARPPLSTVAQSVWGDRTQGRLS